MALSQITQGLLAIIVFLTPLFFLTTTPEYYDTNKQALLFVFIPLLLVIWVVKMIKEKKITVKASKLNLFIALFALSAILSTIIISPNKVESLISPIGTGTIIALTILYFLIVNLVSKKEQVTYPLILAAVFLSLLYIGHFFGLIQRLPFELLKNKLWTPTGSLISLAVVLMATVPLSIEEALLKSQTKKIKRSAAGYIASIIIVTGLVLSIISIIKEGNLTILPFSASWAIAVEALKTIKTAIFGVGPANFVSIYTLAKPISLNSGNFWNLRFNYSGSFLLQVLTELGLFGFLSYGLLMVNIAKEGKRHLTRSVFMALVILFIAQIALPASLVILFYTFAFLGLFVQKTETVYSEQSVILPKIFLALAVVFLISVYWFGYKWYLAEVYFLKSYVAASQNKGLDTYNLQIKAFQTNPYLDKYQISYSQTNLALANSIATQKGASMSDQDRQDISTLIQQAIAAAKTATTLNPQRATNWENLGLIYRNLINAASGADQWAVTAYNQAIRLDPLNPALRVNLGGILFSLKNYDGAIQQFSIAANLKSDWANAHYNLSAAYKEKADYQNAFTEMQKTLALVDPNTNDFTKASQELEDLRTKLPKAPETTLTQPETLTEPNGNPVEVKPKLELPKEKVQPEVPTPSEATPTVQPTGEQITPNI